MVTQRRFGGERNYCIELLDGRAGVLEGIFSRRRTRAVRMTALLDLLLEARRAFEHSQPYEGSDPVTMFKVAA